MEFDLRQMLANWAGVNLTRINGLGADTVLKLLTEIGPNLSHFASVKHFRSWLGLCPGTKISSGKVLSSGTKRAANRARRVYFMLTRGEAFVDQGQRRYEAQQRERPWLP